MASASLSAIPRADTGKGVARSLRRNGEVPGVIYGHGREPQSLAIPARDLDRLLQHVAYESTVIELAIEGRTSRTLIREIQRHPFKRQILHVDFQELVAGETVTVRIPLVLVGLPAEVRTGGAIMDQTLRELEIEVDPANMPNHIDVDVSELAIGHSIHVRDLRIPAGVTVLVDEDTSVVAVHAPRAVTEETVAVPDPDAAAVAEPEVIRAKKPDDEE